MNTTETQDKDTPAVTDATEMETLLAGLESTLQKQFQRLEDDDYDGFLELGGNIADMLQQVCSAQAPMTHVAFDHIKNIRAMHQKLGLTLSLQSDEMASKMKQMKSGKNVIKAYQNGAC